MYNLKRNVSSCFLITAGAALTAAAFGFVILPQGFASGGLTGLSILVSSLLHIPVTAAVWFFNLLVFLLGWYFMGHAFMSKTLLTSILFPAFLDIFRLKNWFSGLAADPLLSALLAGALLGIGTSLVMLGNGSCCGFDTIAIIANKKLHIPVWLVLYVCDFTVIILQMATRPLLSSLYGILVLVIVSLILNHLVTQGKAENQMLIFSHESEDIRDALLNSQDVGLTLLRGETGYLRQPIDVIVTVIPNEKIESVKRCVLATDPTAFFLLNPVRYVAGRRYTFDYPKAVARHPGETDSKQKGSDVI